MKQIHLIMPFMRHNFKGKLIEAYRPMGIIWHPIMFRDEATDFPNEPWIVPYVPFIDSKEYAVLMPGNFKRNRFIFTQEIVDDDYYVTVDDDDMYEAGVFDKIKQMDDDIVIISMKRGHFMPIGVSEVRKYPTTTLYAHSDNVQIGSISAQQSFVKGKIFKAHLFNEDSHQWDGEIAVHHKGSGEQIRYEPDLFALFNYYEPGRWDDGNHKIAFGCMVNDLKRFGVILGNSEIEGIPCYTILTPKSASKGLNKLLEIIESKGAEIGILTHQDMYYRKEWLGKVQTQIALLPENWVIAGLVGKDEKGELCGHFHDMSTPLWIRSDHEFPIECSCIDECTIIVNMKSGFRFDENLLGFDLYGTYAPLRAREMGGTAWIIDAWAEHYCGRFHRGWEPDDRFKAMWKWIYDRFPGQKLSSTILMEKMEERLIIA